MNHEQTEMGGHHMKEDGGTSTSLESRGGNLLETGEEETLHDEILIQLGPDLGNNHNDRHAEGCSPPGSNLLDVPHDEMGVHVAENRHPR